MINSAISYVVPAGIFMPPKRVKEIERDTVEALKTSIKEVGLLAPLHCREVKGRVTLIAGAHRLTAITELLREKAKTTNPELRDPEAWTIERMKQYGAPMILFTDVSEGLAALQEIDENLIRKELGDAKRAALTAQRGEIHKSMYPETRIGSYKRQKKDQSHKRQLGAFKSSKENSDLAKNDAPPQAFYKETAKATGRSERAVQRDEHIGSSLGADTLSKVDGTSLDAVSKLEALAKAPREAQKTLVEKAVSGTTVTLKEVQEAKDPPETKTKPTSKKPPKKAPSLGKLADAVEQIAETTGDLTDTKKTREPLTKALNIVLAPYGFSVQLRTLAKE